MGDLLDRDDSYDRLGNPKPGAVHQHVALEREPSTIASVQTCAVPECGTPISLPRFFICNAHWDQLPPELQHRIWWSFDLNMALGKKPPSEEYSTARASALALLEGSRP